MEICNNPQLCCGCSACQSACPLSAITVIEDNRGFYRPNVDETKCVQCGLCVDVCMKKCITVSPQVRTAELFDFEPRFIYLPKPQARPGILSNFKR